MTHRHPSRGDEGIALVLALLFMLAFSSLGAAVVVLARTETFSSLNYRMMSQARYGAESGVHKAAHYLLNTYTLPGTLADPTSNYNTTVSPVTYLGQPVVLSAIAGVGSNYPVAATQSAFAAAAQGTLPAGQTTVAYSASATLLSMREVVPYGAIAPTVVQTWRLTAKGRISGARTGEVEVSAILERQVVAAHTYAAFATNSGCGALDFSGGVRTKSYDSSNMTLSGGEPVTQDYGSHVGTNGNLTENGNSIVNGSLSTPRSGVGNCRSGAVTALTQNGNAQVTGGIVALPQAVQYSLPDLPNPMPPTTTQNLVSTSGCAALALTAGACTGGAGLLTINPNGATVPLGNLRLTGGARLTLHAGTYNVNSIHLSGGATLTIGSGPVILNVAGQSEGSPIDFSGGAATMASFDPSQFRILYAGTGTMRLTGGTTTTAIVYAPLAQSHISGGADFYGSVLSASITLSGGARINYDRRLNRDFFTTGPQMMSSFTWRAQ